MQNLFKKIRRKLNCLIANLLITGIILLMLAILIVWTNFMVKLVVGFLAVVVAYGFFYAAYKFWSVKNDLEKYFKL